jgi:dTDP-4-amino-4,6-dideoxygalactose transaminase
MQIPYLDLSISDIDERNEYLSLFDEFMQRGRFVGGDALETYKTSLSQLFDNQNISLCSSGTSALYLAGKALNLECGDEVIVPSLSFYATANAFTELGATCVFADLKNNLTICPNSIKSLITKKTKAIVAVHFMGISCAMEEIIQIAKEYDLKVIEDASQSFNTLYRGKKVGTLGDFGCFSTNCMKLLGAMGDSGFIISKADKDHEEISNYLYNGMNNSKECVRYSINHRIDPLQCLILDKRLKNVDKVIVRRAEIAKEYNSVVPEDFRVKRSASDVIYGYTLLLENRIEFQSFLEKNNIEYKIEHTPLMSHLPIYKDHISQTKNAEQLIEKIINIPCHENLTQEQVIYIKSKLEEYFE